MTLSENLYPGLGIIRFGAILMSKHQFYQLFFLKDQALAPAMLVGKLSNNKEE